MSKKRGNRNTNSVKRSLKRKRGGIARQDYRRGGRVRQFAGGPGGGPKYGPGPEYPDTDTDKDTDSGPQEGDTMTGDDGTKYIFTGGTWVAQTPPNNTNNDGSEGDGPPDDEFDDDPGGVGAGETGGGSTGGETGGGGTGTGTGGGGDSGTGVEDPDDDDNVTTGGTIQAFGADPAVVDIEARGRRIGDTTTTVAGTPRPQRGDFPEGDEGQAAYEEALATWKPSGAIAGELPAAAEIGAAEQVGYQRDAEGNLILDENQNPIPLKDAATMKMEEDYVAGPQEAGAVQTAAAATGTTERAVGREPGLNPITILEQHAAKYGEAGFNNYSVTDDGQITWFDESQGRRITMSPAAFAEQEQLETGVSARTAKMKEDLIREDPSIKAAELEGLSEESIARVTEIRELSGPAKAAEITKQAIEAAKAKDVEGVLTKGAFIPEIGGIIRIMSPSPQAEEKTRRELTEEWAQKEAAKIPGGLLWESVKRSPVKGEDAKGAAAAMIEETIDIPPEIARTIVQPAATVDEQLDLLPVDVVPAVAALDPAILVSAQMQDLVGSIETGQIPVWAKPAVEGVDQIMARRGLTASTVGRDALFNAIITQAFPMAQSNAQALQARATQNLTHEQQANIEESRLDMTRRMENLANRQTAASQTAQMAQQMGVLQSQFDIQTKMASEGQEQEVRMQNLENEQQAAVIRSQNQQQINSQQLDAAAQIDLAELRAEEARVGADQSFENQERMSIYQTAADFMAKNEAFTQQMRMANMSEDNQMRLANLQSRNLAASELLSNEERTELANLNSDLQVRLSSDKIASAMDLAQLSVDQEKAVKNAATVANLDMTKFTLEQQVELANSKWMQTAEVTNMTARQQAAMQDATALAGLDMAAVDQRTKLSMQNAQAFLQMDMSNFNADQQAVVLAAQQRQQSLLSNQAATNASRQFNATSENQMNQFMTNMANNMAQFNATQGNAMEQFNAQAKNVKNAQDENREADRQKFNAQLSTGIDQFNNQIRFQRDNWNSANAQAVEQSNTQWRRQANTINTAAQNKINAQNAMNSFNMNQRSMSFLWQELRDQADYDFKTRENERQRKAALAMAALGNEGASYEGSDAWDDRLKAALQASVGAFGALPTSPTEETG